jgi:hypothetical protein
VQEHYSIRALAVMSHRRATLRKPASDFCALRERAPLTLGAAADAACSLAPTPRLHNFVRSTLHRLLQTRFFIGLNNIGTRCQAL